MFMTSSRCRRVKHHDVSNVAVKHDDNVTQTDIEAKPTCQHDSCEQDQNPNLFKTSWVHFANKFVACHCSIRRYNEAGLGCVNHFLVTFKATETHLSVSCNGCAAATIS